MDLICGCLRWAVSPTELWARSLLIRNVVGFSVVIPSSFSPVHFCLLFLRLVFVSAQVPSAASALCWCSVNPRAVLVQFSPLPTQCKSLLNGCPLSACLEHSSAVHSYSPQILPLIERRVNGLIHVNLPVLLLENVYAEIPLCCMLQHLAGLTWAHLLQWISGKWSPAYSDK